MILGNPLVKKYLVLKAQVAVHSIWDVRSKMTLVATTMSVYIENSNMKERQLRTLCYTLWFATCLLFHFAFMLAVHSRLPSIKLLEPCIIIITTIIIIIIITLGELRMNLFVTHLVSHLLPLPMSSFTVTNGIDHADGAHTPIDCSFSSYKYYRNKSIENKRAFKFSFTFTFEKNKTWLLAKRFLCMRIKNSNMKEDGRRHKDWILHSILFGPDSPESDGSLWNWKVLDTSFKILG